MSQQNENYRIAWLIRRLFRAMAHKASENLAVHGLTAADRAVLEFLYPDLRLSVPEIASRYQVSRQHVQVTVNRLLKKGLLRRISNPRHKRSVLIELTEAGGELFREISDRDKATLDALMVSIPARERQTTRKTLEALLINLSEGE